jgi:hypothetical protein
MQLTNLPRGMLDAAQLLFHDVVHVAKPAL